MNNSSIMMYQAEDGKTKLEVRFQDETVWLSQQLMAELFQTSIPNINIHIKNIFTEGELERASTIKEFLIVQKEGKRNVSRDVEFYNLDMIISVGYRISSIRGTQFRQWATQRLKEYLIKGFTMDDERLKGSGGGNYWKELLERIRDIRSSEKVLYRQVLELYATSVDYDPDTQESIRFFKTVQNKLHYAVNKKTAAETIYSRADAEKDFMGLTTFTGEIPIKAETKIAKNYLNEDELFRLNRLVSAFFDLAEIKAREHTRMLMKDWIAELDKFTKMYGKGVLPDAGKISHNEAMQKAEKEYLKYHVKTLSPVERAYLETIKTVQKKVEKKQKRGLTTSEQP
ncbi:MAG: cell filamentation protein Fic [Candidatus Firestonebacteria bacterium RIFOXYC2_FULL_39_67]|nr:MAG: cell filamentation protein Fic [Candidatus Firestonebacteria bacterium RIFOXYD2_FULL_39_29]OGF56987.1 MAG: cell filamentation protein Fic [Candidatus Firestonebacteria bacterium RIFOXYC2_FULL_39_67]